MSTTLFGLREFGDAGAFLAGARIPLITTDGRRAECAGDLVFVWNPTTASYGSCAVARMGRESWLLMDLADPDVARWCDRKIGKALGFVNPDHGVLGCTNKWCFWWVGDECPWFLADWRPELHRAMGDIPCTDANIPTARAALLRALFGVSNA